MAKEIELRSLEDGTSHSLRLEQVENGFRVIHRDPPWTVLVAAGASEGSWWVLDENGVSHEALVERRDGELRIDVDHARYRMAASDRTVASGARDGASARVEVKAPMPGKIVELLASPGDALVAGQPVLLFEAMKMQNELRSPQDGIVAAILVQTGQTVESRELLYVLDPPPI